jgi:hypothetical protein
MLRKVVDICLCEACVQYGTYTKFSSGLASLQHVTVGIAESRCTVGAGETKTAVCEPVLEAAVSSRTD